jgi:hypothetical protein
MLQRADITAALTSDILEVPALKSDLQVVVATDRIGQFASLYCIRTSTDGNVWTSDTIIATQNDDGTWFESWSGGTTFGAPDLERCWDRAWMACGDTVSGEYETEDGALTTVMAVSGFAAPWVDRILLIDGLTERWLTPHPPWNAFVATAHATTARLTVVRPDGSTADPIEFTVPPPTSAEPGTPGSPG